MKSNCPICSRATVTAFRPFCSRRCADLDLQKWLVGAYVLPASDDDAPPTSDPDDA